MLKYLLERGANPNAIHPTAIGHSLGNSVLKTVLTMPADTEARQIYKTKIINMLLDYGALL